MAIIQRFTPHCAQSAQWGPRGGAALNLNVHVHALVLDGVYAEDGSGGVWFHPALPPTDEEMGELLDTIARRIYRLLARRGVVDGGETIGTIKTLSPG